MKRVDKSAWSGLDLEPNRFETRPKKWVRTEMQGWKISSRNFISVPAAIPSRLWCNPPTKVSEMSTAHDREILNHIFNPLLPLSGELVQEEEVAQDDQPELIEAEDEVTHRSKTIELQGIRQAELGHFDAAIDLLSASIKLAPLRASGYNNRAQTFRLLGNVAEAKVDLNNAINLSHGKGRAGCQALCQRGLIALRENRSEDAKVDFEAAAKLGSQFAKAQLVQMNPYAALCNRMLRDVMGKLQRGESEYYQQTNGIGTKKN